MTGPTVDPGKLMESARGARRNAYAPYSGFTVGAAILAESGEIYTGCNVENASYGLSSCAERNAVFQAVGAVGPGLRIIAVSIAGTPGQPAYPCGACRQVLSELAANIPVFVEDGDQLRELHLAELLPHAFEINNAGAEGAGERSPDA